MDTTGLNFGLEFEKGERKPALGVHGLYITGGLLLTFNMHHSTADAFGIKMLMEDIATLSCNMDARVGTQPKKLPSLGPKTQGTIPNSEFPEYAGLWESHSGREKGPSQTVRREPPAEDLPKSGKIFVFEAKKLKELAGELASRLGAPSKKVSKHRALTALVWTHMSAARLPDRAPYTPEAHLLTPKTWREMFHAETKNYLGNALVTVATVVENAHLCGIPGKQGEEEYMQALAVLAGTIDDRLGSVDQDFVRKREALYNEFLKSRDPGDLVLSWDVCAPGDLHFNTWLGAWPRGEWCLTGQGRCEPVAVRRSGLGWMAGGGLVMPAKEGSRAAEWEVVLAMEDSAMERLCADERFMRWVSRVVSD